MGTPQGTVSLKVLHSWDPCLKVEYQSRDWAQDVLLWSLVTDLNEQQQGPAVVLQLHGVARKVRRQVGAEITAN